MALSLVRAEGVKSMLFWAFLLLLCWIPIPLGSNRPWAWAVLEVGVFSLVSSWLIAWAVGGVKTSPVMRAAWPAWLLLAFWVFEQAIHIVPLPMAVVGLLSPESARMHGLVEALGIKRDWATISVDPHASRVSLLKTLAYAGCFLLVLALVDTRARLLMLARTLVAAAMIHSAYAVLMHLSGGNAEWFGTMVTHGAQASGTYVNRNHFAGYLEMMLAIGIGLLMAGLSDRHAESWRDFVRNLLEWLLSPKMVLRLALCVLVIALTTTHSRMGNTAFFSSLLIAGAIGIAMSRNATRSTVVLLVSLVVIDLLIVGSWFGVEKLARRIEQTTTQEVQEREEPAAHTIGLIRNYPVLGAGPGTFYVAFEAYRPETVKDFYDYAHNDYVQFASESGVLGIGILGIFVALALNAALRAQWHRRDSLMRGLSFACIMGVTSILIHSSVDFNLQIPANAVYFMVLLALGWVSLHHHSRDP